MSIFLPAGKRPLLTFLLQEALAAVIQANPDIPFDEAIVAAHVRAGLSAPSPGTLTALAERLLTPPEKPASPEPVSKGSGMGKALMEWMRNLPTDQLCLLACDLDPVRARNLYCETDIEIAEVVVGLYMDRAWQDFRARFEASLYGFGGSLDGTEEVAAIEVDMNDNAQVMDMISSLKSMGF